MGKIIIEIQYYYIIHKGWYLYQALESKVSVQTRGKGLISENGLSDGHFFNTQDYNWTMISKKGAMKLKALIL